jgi:hypothetical protein
MRIAFVQAPLGLAQLWKVCDESWHTGQHRAGKRPLATAANWRPAEHVSPCVRGIGGRHLIARFSNRRR